MRSAQPAAIVPSNAVLTAVASCSLLRPNFQARPSDGPAVIGRDIGTRESWNVGSIRVHLLFAYVVARIVPEHRSGNHLGNIPITIIAHGRPLCIARRTRKRGTS